MKLTPEINYFFVNSQEMINNLVAKTNYIKKFR